MVIKNWNGSALVSTAYLRWIWPWALVVIVLIGASCSLDYRGRVPDHHRAVVATGRHCVDTNSARECEAATIVSSESELPDALGLWGYATDAVDFAGETLVLVGYEESSTCQAQVDGVMLADGVLDVTIRTLGSDECTTDAGLRSFIIQVTEAEPIDAVTINGTEVELLSP